MDDADNGHREPPARVHRLQVTPERLGAIHQARGALAAGGVPTAAPVPTLREAPRRARRHAIRGSPTTSSPPTCWPGSGGERPGSAVGPRQLVHGDFWDDNVLFGNGRPVLLADLGRWRDTFA